MISIKQVNCGICALSGDTIAMELKNDYFVCSQCGAELYLNDEGDDTFIKQWRRQSESDKYISRSLPEGVHVHGGGDPVGTTKKGAMKKKSLSKLNTLLYDNR